MLGRDLGAVVRVDSVVAAVSGRVFAGDAFVLEVFAQADCPVLASCAAGFVAAERTVEAVRGSVDGDGAGANASSDLQRRRCAGRPDPSGQAVFRVVGDPDGVVDVVVGDDNE